MASRPIRIRDRETGKIVEEPLYGERELRFLYERPLGRALTDLVLRDERFSALCGLFQRSRRSRRRIPDFIRRLGINADESELPPQEYPSLDAFFTRRLKPGARPFDANPEHLACPADGRLLVYPSLDDAALRVKGCRITLAELVGNAKLAEKYRRGAAAVVRLAPADYHRFHFPDAGRASAARCIGRGLYSVHQVALEAGAPAFRNKRMISGLASAGFGTVQIIEVGALIVGTIVQTYYEGPVKRGEQKGYFRFGGSTVILLLEEGKVRWDDDLVEGSGSDLETLVKAGTRIGRRP